MTEERKLIKYLLDYFDNNIDRILLTKNIDGIIYHKYLELDDLRIEVVSMFDLVNCSKCTLFYKGIEFNINVEYITSILPKLRKYDETKDINEQKRKEQIKEIVKELGIK